MKGETNSQIYNKKVLLYWKNKLLHILSNLLIYFLYVPTLEIPTGDIV